MGAAKDLTLKLTNTGAQPAPIATALIDNSAFQLVSPNLPFTLVAGTEQTLTVRFSPADTSPQKGVLAVAGLQVALTGTGTAATCTFSISGDTLTASSFQTALIIGITASAPTCTWNASSNAIWIHVTSGATDTGNGSVRLTIDANPGAQRSGTLTVAGRSQAGGQRVTTLLVTRYVSLASLPVVNYLGTGQDALLKIDSGQFDTAVGFPSGTATAYFVTRLTPPRYPASLKDVRIYFADRTDGLRRNDPISVVYGANPSGSLSIDGVTLARLPGTVTKLGDFNVFDVPAVTITSGDFVVGFVAANAPGMFPGDVDIASASQRRSHVSSDGVHFTLLDDVGSGNIGVRATVRLP